MTTLLRAYLRRDRWMLLAWVVGIVLTYYATAASIPSIYTTQAALDEAAALMEGNAAYVAMAGPTRAIDTIGGQVAWQCQAFGAVLVGLMSMFLVVRHTRADEESGRDEMIRAAAVARPAPAVAGVLVSLGANLVVGLLVALSLIPLDLAVADSLALGLGLTACGWVYTGTAAVAAQLGSTARSAYGYAGGLLALTYALRAVGDLSGGALSWLSPIGWYQYLHAFSGLRWWPLLISLAATAGVLALAATLFARRDYGGGVWPARPGPAHGRLHSALALAWRLQRGQVVGWCLGMLAFGLAYGAIGDDVEGMLGDSEAMQEAMVLTGGTVTDGFFAYSIMLMAICATAFSITSARRPHAEEESGHLESLLATALPRRTWLGGHVLITVVGTAAVVAAGGAGLGLGYLMVTGDGDYAWRITWPILMYLPAVLLLSALARLVYGLLPQRMILAWLPLAAVFVLMMFGQLLRFPDWLVRLSPFQRIAQEPVAPFELAPVVVLTVLATLVSLAGQFAFTRRDIG